MRNKLFLLWIAGLFCASCSVDEVMKLEKNLNVILLETIELPEKHVGDTISFKVFAGTNDVIERMEITNMTHDFSKMLLDGGIRYEIIDDTLYTDATGYFNRPVSSVVVNYPIIVGRELLEQVVGLDFTFHTDQGVTKSARAQMKIINYKLNPDKKDVYGLLKIEENEEDNTVAYSLNGTPFYSFDLNVTNNLEFMAKGPDEKTKVTGEEWYDHLDLFELQEYTATDTIDRFYSADHIRVQEVADLFGMEYDHTKARHTLFMELPEEFDFKSAEDPEINALDFTNASDIIVIHYNSNIAFKTQDGFRGVMHVTKNSRNDGTVTPVIEVKIQTVATEE